LGDPALDFSYLVYCGPLSFVRRAVNAYELPVDAAFLERTIFLARMRTLAWVAGSIRSGWGPTPYMRFLRNAFEDDPMLGYSPLSANALCTHRTYVAKS